MAKTAQKPAIDTQKGIPMSTDSELVDQIKQIAQLLNTTLELAAKRSILVGVNLSQKETELSTSFAQVNVLTAHKDLMPRHFLIAK